MLKSTKILYTLLPLLILTPACHKQTKGFNFTGRENAQQAFAKCVQLSTRKKFQQAIDCLEIFKSRFSNTPYVLDAELRIADAYFRKKEYLLAAETYQLFTKLHPTSPKLDYAYYRMGLAYLHDTPKQIDRDQENLPAAVEAFAIVFNQFPDSPYAKMSKIKHDEARRLIAKRHLYIGKFYYKSGEYRAAIPRFEEIFNKFSGLGLDESALYYIATSYWRLGLTDEAKLVAELMKSKFPKSSKTKDVLKEVKSEG